MKGIVGIVSPPYEEATDGGGIFKKGYVGNFSHSKNPDTVGNRTYSNKTHNFSKGQIGSLKSQTNQELDFDITKYHKCDGELYWHGCYGSENYYKNFVTPESYAHPAKISFLLVERILKHLEHLGLLKKGMTVCDFMAGSGRIPLIASLKGYDSVGVELEPHFIKMCEDNKKFAENKIGRKLNFEIIQGDSRQLSKILNKGDVGITSPPFESSTLTQDEEFIKKIETQHRQGSRFQGGNVEGYGNNPSNIGNLPYKEMVGVVSPPYQDGISGGKSGIEWQEDWGRPSESRQPSQKIEYSQNPQNIGNLKDTQLVGITSPPYEEGLGHISNNVKDFGILRLGSKAYGETEGQIGRLKEQGQSYLSAMFQVYQEAYKSGIQVLVTITKNPTRAGKLRRLDLDTLRLLEGCGYSCIDYHRAILFKTYEQQTFNGEVKKEYKGRLSFFKRLSLSKGNTAAEFEDVIIAKIVSGSVSGDIV